MPLAHADSHAQRARLDESRPGVAVALYELIREPRAAAVKPEPIKPASAGDIDRLTVLLLEALQTSGYTNPRTAKSTEEKVRRLVRRLNLPARDIEIWLGIFRQILWKLSDGGGDNG